MTFAEWLLTLPPDRMALGELLFAGTKVYWPRLCNNPEVRRLRNTEIAEDAEVGVPEWKLARRHKLSIRQIRRLIPKNEAA